MQERKVISMGMSEKIRILLIKRGNLSQTELAKKLNTSPQNLNDKLKRDNFTERELQAIASALDCTFTATFTMNDTGETI